MWIAWKYGDQSDAVVACVYGDTSTNCFSVCNAFQKNYFICIFYYIKERNILIYKSVFNPFVNALELT